jgi:hypothetical protein
MKKKKRRKTKSEKGNDLSELAKLTRIIATPIAIEQIEKLVSTDDRKAIWVLCSGKLTRKQIASKTNIPERTVSHFIDECKTFGVLDEEKEKGGHPKPVIDYIPSGWTKLAKKKKKTSEEQKSKLSVEKG